MSESSSLRTRFVLACVLGTVLFGSGIAQRADAPGINRPHLVPAHEASGRQWSLFHVQGPGRTIQVFLSHDSQPKPVVFLLQGSGCTPSFTVGPDERFQPTSIFQDVVAAESRRVHFAIVEKVGVTALRFTAGMTRDERVCAFEQAQKVCSAEFFDHATKSIRVDDVLDAITAVSSEPWAHGVLLAGHSEGTHVATGVLKLSTKGAVDGVALFSSAGPVPFWSGYVAAGAGQRSEFQSAFDRVRMLQSAPDDLMHYGLPARRWKTFWLESTPIEDVRDSDVPLFVVHGTRDGTILAPDLFVLEAIRQQPRRPLRYVVVEGGDHAMETLDHRSHVPTLFSDFVSWVLDPNRQTGTRVIK
jgi:hypothetical protein